MKQNFIKWMSNKSWIYRLSMKLIANRIVWGNNILTPKYLLDRGFIEQDGFYFEPEIKDRDLITIQFEHHHYRVWHSKNKTFIALKSSIEWFETYYLLVHDSDKIFELAGV